MRNFVTDYFRRKRFRMRRILPLFFAMFCIHTLVQWDLLGRSAVDSRTCLNTTERERLKTMTLTVAKALDHLNQTYWLDFDCLLGAMTLHRVLPRYSHCDFGRLANSDHTTYFQQKLERYLRQRLQITDYQKPDLKYGRTIIHWGRLEVNIYSYLIVDKTDHIDVCFESIKDAISILGYSWHRMWRTGLPKTRFLPTRKTLFYGEEINVPRDSWGVIGFGYEFIHQVTKETCHS